MPRNRLHTYTRWPADPERRLSMALTDQAFCRVMERIGFSREPALLSIASCAEQVRVEALAELKAEH